jgi:hypothetical protein
MIHEKTMSNRSYIYGLVDHSDVIKMAKYDPLKLDRASALGLRLDLPSFLEKGEPDILGWLVFSGSRI